MDWEFGISRCKLLYIEWINNKVLLYSTGNYIQYSVTGHLVYDKGARIYNGEKTASSIIGAEKTGQLHVKE